METTDGRGERTLQVRLEAFEGPLDLLLHLIRESKIDIYDIPIAQITTQYLEYLDLMQKLDLDVASEFLVMAATLTHIKSRMLLPTHEPGDEEEDPRNALVAQLLEYQRYKEASLGLKEMLEERSLHVSREGVTAPAPREEFFMDVSLFELLKVFREVMAEAGNGHSMVIAPERFSVVDKMREIVDLLQHKEWIDFREIFQGRGERAEIVACFLALLELVRLRMIRLTQEGPGAPIALSEIRK